MPEPDLPPSPAAHPESDAEREDAAPPTATELREDGRSRLWRAFSRPTRGQVVVAVLLALVGFAGVTQVRTNQVDDTYAGLRQQDLIDILNGLAGTTQRAQAEIQRLEATRDDLQSDTSARQAALEQARQQAAGAEHPGRHRPGARSGRPDHHHGGVRAGAGRSRSSTWSRRCGPRVPRPCRSTDEVRVVAQTSFEDGTGGLLVDGRLLEAPFTVDVIGPPDALVSRPAVPGRARRTSSREDDGAELTFEDVSSVDIEAVREPGRG